MAHGHEKRSRVTRARILDAAEPIFLAKGFAGASMAAIARDAGVNQSLISHHFGSKAGLLKASWTRLYRRYFEQQQVHLERPEEGSLDMLRDSITTYFRHLKETPGAVRLQAWIFLSGQDKPFPEVEAVVKRGFERLEQAQEEGLLRTDIPAEFIWASFIGLAHFWFQLREQYSGLLQDAVGPREDLDEAYLTALLKIFFEGVQAPG